jgi:zinc protease
MNRLAVGGFLACLWLLAGATSAIAEAGAVKHAAPKTIRTIEGVTEYRLSNGLQVLLDADPSSSTVTVNVTYKVGSRHESYGETGMAHLLEHLNFKGTPGCPDILGNINRRGAIANATTSYDRTNYFETFEATASNLSWFLTMEADRMVHSFIARKDLDSEMTVVRNEFEMGENNPAYVLGQRVMEAAFSWHNYGHPTIGARSDIENVSIERLKAFYRTYYQPDNATLIVTGNFEPTAVLRIIQKTFGAVPRPSRVLPQLYTAEPPQDGEREIVLRRTGAELILTEAFHIPAEAHADTVPLGVLVDLLNQKPDGLLYKYLVVPKLAVTTIAHVQALHDPGVLRITVTLPEGADMGVVRHELDLVLAEARNSMFSPQAIERVVNHESNDYERMLDSPQQTASALSDNAAVGDWRFLFWDRERLHQVSAADIQRVASVYLIDSNRTTGLFLPEEHSVRAVIPNAPDSEKVLAHFTGGPPIPPGEQFLPTSSAIEARVRRGNAGMIKTAYLAKKTRGGRVSASLRLEFGDVRSLQGTAEVGPLTAALLLRGSTLRDSQQIQDQLTRLKATLEIVGTATGLVLALETTQENLGQALILMAELLRHPSFPSGDLEELKRSALEEIDLARDDPEDLAELTVKRNLSPYERGDFRYVATAAERAAAIKLVTVEDTRQFYQRFFGANAAQFALVGNFDADQVTQQLTTLFGGWRSTVPFQRAGNIYRRTIGASDQVVTPDKASAALVVGGTLALRDDDPSFAPFSIANTILGGGVLNSRLATRIREKDGLSYNVSSSIAADPWDASGIFMIHAICAPQNLKQLEQDVQEELAKALSSGFTTLEIADAKQSITKTLLVHRASDAALAADLTQHLYLDRDYRWDVQFEEAINSASPSSINASVGRFIDPAHLVWVKAGDLH